MSRFGFSGLFGGSVCCLPSIFRIRSPQVLFRPTSRSPSHTSPSHLGQQSPGSTTRGPAKARSARPARGIVNGGVERPCLLGRRLSGPVLVGLFLAGPLLSCPASVCRCVCMCGTARPLLLRLALQWRPSAELEWDSPGVFASRGRNFRPALRT